LSAATGALTTTPTWSTTTACPSGQQASAEISEFTLSGTLVSRISPAVNSGLTAPFSGTLDGSVGALLNVAGISATSPGTLEWAVGCYTGTGGTGTAVFVQSEFVTATAAGNYTTSASGPVVTNTSTTLTAAPNPAGAGASVTLTATETPAAAGSVAFMNGATVIATVPVNASGVATTTFTTPSPFTSALTLTANFTPTDLTSFGASSGSTTLNSNAVNTATNSPVTINVTVAATGTLSVSVATPATASLTVSGLTGTGTLPNVSILDTRNTSPGWSVSGQESAFTSTATPSTPISGNQLGWVPAAATGSATFDGTHVALGGTVNPASPGLGTTAAVLALAHAGFGADPTGATTYIATAALNLAIPAATTAGAYSGSLAITYITSQA
jgi:hypothetical protein